MGKTGRPRKYPEIKIGDIYLDMKVVKYLGKYKNGNHQYEVSCTVCGRTKTILDQDIFKGKGLTHKNSCKNKNIYKPILVNDIYGDMIILEECGRQAKSGNKILLVKCLVCGVEKETTSSNINNKSGIFHGPACKRQHNTTYKRQINKKSEKHLKYIHDHKRMYRIWKAIIQRINNPKNSSYYRYGGRGIQNEFSSFEEFVDLMGKSYYEHVNIFGESNTTIDRKNNDGNYSFENCRWATYEIQETNKSKNRLFIAISPNGNEYVAKSIKNFAKEQDLDSYEIFKCLEQNNNFYNGWYFKYHDSNEKYYTIPIKIQ